MSKGQTLRDVVVGRLVAATEEIFELFEKTIAEYEEELYRSKEESRRKQRLLDLVITPTVQLVRVDAQTTLTDEESEEHDEEDESATHQRGQIEHRKAGPGAHRIPSPSPCATSLSQEVTLITLSDGESEEYDEEEPSTPQQRQSEPRKKRQKEEDISSESDCEIQTVNSDSADDKNCEPPVSSAECLETETGGDQDKQVQIGGDMSVLKTSALENNGGRLDSDGGAESMTPLRKKRCKKHQCPVCRMTFKYKMDLRVHSRAHATGGPLSCSICNKTFSHFSHLVAHQRKHSKEVSKKTFSQSGDLNPQKRKHVDEKPFSCTLCKTTFRRRGDLDAHQRGDAEETPYRGPKCKKTFCQRSHGNPQKRKHKDEKPFSCTSCKKRFRCRRRLEVHQRKHTKEKPRCCSLLYTV